MKKNKVHTLVNESDKTVNILSIFYRSNIREEDRLYIVIPILKNVINDYISDSYLEHCDQSHGHHGALKNLHISSRYFDVVLNHGYAVKMGMGLHERFMCDENDIKIVKKWAAKILKQSDLAPIRMPTFV